MFTLRAHTYETINNNPDTLIYLELCMCRRYVVCRHKGARRTKTARTRASFENRRGQVEIRDLSLF